MTPTQPTSEEQVEDWIDNTVCRWIDEAVNDARLPEAQKLRACRTQLRALLTQQSQERAELEELRAVWATVPADLFNDTAHNERVGESWREAYIARMKEAVDAKTELDRAVEREAVEEVMNLVDGMSADLAHRNPEAARQLAIVGSRLERALAASLGKGAEGDCHGNCGAEYANFNCPKCRDPEAAPIEDEEPADG